MNILLIREFIDSCHTADKIISMFPKLPDGLTPRHIKVILAIHEQLEASGTAKISDISTAMNSTKPSITKLINELAEHGAVIKTPDSCDKRITRISLTDVGEHYYDSYCIKNHSQLAEILAEIPDEDFEITVRTMRCACHLLKQNHWRLTQQK